MTTSDRTVQYTKTYELLVKQHKCIIQVTIYTNEDLKIVVEDLVARDVFRCDESTSSIESITSKCKAFMTSVDFYNVIESVFEKTNIFNGYRCDFQNDSMILTFLINMPLAHGKNLCRTIPLTLIRQEQEKVDQIENIMYILNCKQKELDYTRSVITEVLKIIEDTGLSKKMLDEWKTVMDTVRRDVMILERKMESGFEDVHMIFDEIKNWQKFNGETIDDLTKCFRNIENKIKKQNPRTTRTVE